jgi:GntR family transcriptional regulator/MocR family aminotransferase
MILLLDGQGLLYEQIARSIRIRILDGSFQTGMKLPSSRELALILKVSRRSVVDAYDLLATEGMVQPVAGAGTVVSPPPDNTVPVISNDSVDTGLSRFAQRAKALTPVSLMHTSQGMRYSFQYGAPLVNARVSLSWARKLTAAAKRTVPNYGLAIGHPALRAAIAQYLTHRRGVQCSADDVLIVSGTQQAISLAVRVLLNEGDAAIVEDPFYELAVKTLIAHGADISYVRTDKDGLCVNEIPKSSARLAWVTPAHQFPSGVEMSMQRRLELLAWARDNGAWILEDNYDSEFHGGRELYRSLYSMDVNDRVIYIGSFSKSLFPSIRLGYMVCPKRLKSVLVRAKMLDDLGCPVPEQAALATFIQSGLYEKQLRASIREVMIRRKVLVHELQRAFKDAVEIGPHQSGMHLVLWFKKLEAPQLQVLIQEAAKRQIAVQSVEVFYKATPPYPGLLLGYASMNAADIRAAVRRLAQCVPEAIPSRKMPMREFSDERIAV